MSNIAFSLVKVSKGITQKPFYRAVGRTRNAARESLRPAVAKIKNFKVLSAGTEEV